MKIVAVPINGQPPRDAVRLVERRRFTLIFECTGEPAPAIVRTAASPIQRRKPPQPVPRDAWPAKFIQIAAERIAGEVGVGDTASRIEECECITRRWRWNLMYPYDST